MRHLAIAIATFAVLILDFQLVNSQPPPINRDGVELHVEMGLGGTWKVGYPSRTQISIKSGSQPINGRLEIQTYDGDGVPVVYENQEWNIQLAANSSTQIEAAVKHGRGNRPIAIRIVNDLGNTIYERSLGADERGTPIPATQPWIVGIGSDRLNLDQASMKSAKGALPEYSTATLTQPHQLPTLSTSYEGVDVLVLSSRNALLNQDMNEASAEAIRMWIVHGGRCALTLGSNADSWSKHPNLIALLPGEFHGVATGCQPGRFESFLGSQSPLSNLNCAIFTLTSGTTELMSQTPNRAEFPFFSKWAIGGGKVSFLATEIDSPELINWNSRPEVLKLLIEDQWEKKDTRTDKLLYQGYDDLSGQLNSTLDYFPNLTLGDLTSISILTGILCLIIGPLDYFVVSRAWRRPRGTWITLATCSVGSCLVAVGMAKSWKPSTPFINTLELVDIDVQSQSLIGRGYAHFYGGNRGEFDFSAHRRVNGATTDATGSYAVPLNWFGQPGKGLGGFDSTVATDRGMPVYRVVNTRSKESDLNATIAADAADAADRTEKQSGIYGVGIPRAGTKAIYAQWNEPISIESESHSLSMVPGSIDLLQGSFLNPLDMDLLDSILIYRRRAYTLPTRLRKGEQVSLSSMTLPKDIVRRLQRRQNVGGEERSSPWNPADTGKLGRLLELIAFHQAAGGSSYTSLYNRYLGSLDCSDVIRLDRAILLAEVQDPSLTWSIRRDSIPVQAIDGQRKTFVRLIIPVAR